MKSKIAIAGLGNVGKGLLKMWGQLERWAADKDIDMLLVAAIDSSGAVINKNGIKAKSLLDHKTTYKNLSGFAGFRNINMKGAIDIATPDILIDLTPTNIETGEPGFQEVVRALENGINVVVSSKNHLRSVSALREIENAAKKHGALFLDGPSVMGGIPVFEIMNGMNIKISSVRAILNGSSNYILGLLEEKQFDGALSEAMRMGYAEANYEYDIKGHDSALKAVGLCYRLFGRKISVGQVRLKGISEGHIGIDGIKSEYIRKLKKNRKSVKLICSIERKGDRITASVAPTILDSNDQFAKIEGVNNAIEIKGKANGSEFSIFLSGPGAGGDATASRVAGNLKMALECLRRCGHG